MNEQHKMNSQALATTKEEKAIEFIPFGAADKIKLSVAIIQNLVATKTRGGKTCSPGEAMKFMMLAQAQRLNPFAGDAYLVGYDGKDGIAKFSLITAHQALLKRAETCTDYEGMESGIILRTEDGNLIDREGDFLLQDEVDQLVGGWAIVYRKGRKPTKTRLSIAQRRPNYPTPFWDGVKAAEQIAKCAEANSLRLTFPTLLGGLYTEAESIIDITASSGRTAAATVPEALLAASAPARDIEPVDEEPTHGQQIEDSQPTKASNTPQAQLETLVTGAGFTLDHLLKWGAGTKNIENSDSIPSFDDIPASVATRILRARAGLLKGLADVKGGAA